MIRPNYLNPGDKVVILSTARKISKEEVDPSVALFSSWGLEVILGSNLFAEYHQFAGTDSQRLSDLQKAFDDPEIKAVFCARGGYGTARLLDQLDLSGFQKSPKWLVGYSDVTALHLHLQKHSGVETLHATMPINIHANPDEAECQSVDSLKAMLFGESAEYQLSKPHNPAPSAISGTLTGGNLSMIYSLLGSDSIPSFRGSILFLEDLDEYLYHVDRMMLNLKRNRVFDELKAVVVGGLSDMNDNTVPYGKTAHEIVMEHLKDFKFPVYSNFPAGHQSPNLALPFGRKVTIVNDVLSV